MQVFVLLIMAVTMTQAENLPPLFEENSRSPLKDERSLLSSLLMASGYSDICVAAALDFCSTKKENCHYVSLMEEAREVVQQLSAAVNKLNCHLSAALNESDSHLSAAVNESDSQLSVDVNECEYQVNVAVNKWDSNISIAGNISESLPRHCKDLLESGDNGTGMRQIYPYYDRPMQSVTVFCDHTIDGGGWTVFQRRTSDAVRQTFYRSFSEYQFGFGDIAGEYWMGLDLLHQLTSTTLQQLRIDLADYEGEHRFAKYGYFHVGGPNDNYRLGVGSYTGDAGDSLAHHNGEQFTTYDADNDKEDNGNCAESREGGWWYYKCAHVNLNGYQYVGSDSPQDKGIFWDSWRGDRYSLKQTTMMTRPAH